MSFLARHRIGGHRQQIAAPQAPSQVGNPTPGSPTATTIPVTYTPALGAPTITYAGWTSLHGANSWTLNSGTFLSTGGTFIGLSPMTDYDWRIVAHNAFNPDSTTDYLAGTTTAAAPPTTLSATRYDIVLDRSSGPVGTTGTATIYGNAVWAGDGVKAITLSGTGASFPSGASVVIPSSGTAPLTITYQITGIGELSISGSNTGGLYNPYPAPFNAFASTSGTAQTITSAAISANKTGGTNLDLQAFQRDTAAGNPAGWSTGFGRGWGEVFVTLGSSGPALFAKLVDADSSGASGTVGTGTYLQSTPVQVYGAFSAGTSRLLLPAGPKVFYLELATDSAFTNPVRVQQRFIVGIVIAVCGASQQAETLLTSYPYGGATATGVDFNGVVSTMNTVPYYPTASGFWFRYGNNVTGGNTYGGSSSAAQEFARILCSQLGVYVGLAASAMVGEPFTDWLGADGSLAAPGAQTIFGYVNNKFRYWWNNWVNGTTQTSFVWSTALAGFQAKMPTAYPACALYLCNFGMDGVITNGSAQAPAYSPGWGRMQAGIIAAAAQNPMMVSADDYHCNGQTSGHWTMASRMQWARVNARNVIDCELASFGGRQTLSLGPALASTGTANQAGRTITIPFRHNGGTTLSALAINDVAGGSSGTAFSYTSDATSAEIAALFAVYVAGGYYGNGKAVAITGATISQTSPPAGYNGTITLTLSGSAGVMYADNTTDAYPAAGFTVQFVADTDASINSITWGGGRAIVLVDDQVDSPNGIPFGRHAKQALDIQVSVV